MIPVVISDIHSRSTKLHLALHNAGVLDMHGVRNPGYQLIQLGDAVSAGYGMKEAQFYREWTALLEPQDVELVGNHEMPILSKNPYIVFYGFNKGDMGTDGCDPELIPLVLERQAQYKAAHVVNDWLITHAGVSKRYQRDTAQKTADYLNSTFEGYHQFKCPCCICDPANGPLWVRDLEKTAKDPTQIKQMFGHTPDGPTLSKGGTMWNIDTPRIKPLDYEDGVNVNRGVTEDWGGVCVMRWDDATSNWEQFYVA